MEGPPAPPAPPVAPKTKPGKILRYGNRHHHRATPSEGAHDGCGWEVFVETRGGWPAAGGAPGETGQAVERVTFNVDGVLHHRVQAPYQLNWRCHGRDQRTSSVKVGITVEFTGGSEPPLTLEHALAHDAASWTDVYLPACKAVALPPPSSKNLQVYSLFDELVSSKDSSSRLVAVEPYLTKKRLCKTLSGSSHRYRSLLLVRGDKVTPLHVAVLLKDRALIELLLRHGADPNQSGEALSMTYVPPDPKTRKVCTAEDMRRAKELLVERGTPLHLALMTDNAEVAVRLLQAGADPWLRARKARKAKGSFTSSCSVEYEDVTALHLICDRSLAIAAKQSSHDDDDTKRQELLSAIFTLLITRGRISGGDMNKLAGKVKSSSQSCFQDSDNVSVKRATPLWLLLHAVGKSPLMPCAESFLREMIELGADPLVPCASRVNLVGRSGEHEAKCERACKSKSSETWSNFNCFHLAVLNQHCGLVDALTGAVGLPTKPAKASVTTTDGDAKEGKRVIACESLVDLVRRLGEPEMQQHFKTMLGLSEL